MLDIGWPELMVIIVMTILVVGPQEIPKVLKTIRDIISRVRGVAREFTNQIDEVVRESELENYKDEAMKLATGDNDPRDLITSTMDPEGDIQKTIDENSKDMAEKMQEIARKTNENFKTDTRPQHEIEQQDTTEPQNDTQTTDDVSSQDMINDNADKIESTQQVGKA